MDMQPIAPLALEAEEVDQHRHHGRHSGGKVAATASAIMGALGDHDGDEQPPLLMMTSTNSEETISYYGDNNDSLLLEDMLSSGDQHHHPQSSISKWLLLHPSPGIATSKIIDYRSGKKSRAVLGGSNASSSHPTSNKTSAGVVVGVGGKISRALFRSKANGSVPKKQQDTRGTHHLFRRSARSSFRPVESSSSNYYQNNHGHQAMDFGPVVSMPSDEQMSFDITSTNNSREEDEPQRRSPTVPTSSYRKSNSNNDHASMMATNTPRTVDKNGNQDNGALELKRNDLSFSDLVSFKNRVKLQEKNRQEKNQQGTQADDPVPPDGKNSSVHSLGSDCSASSRSLQDDKSELSFSDLRNKLEMKTQRLQEKTGQTRRGSRNVSPYTAASDKNTSTRPLPPPPQAPADAAAPRQQYRTMKALGTAANANGTTGYTSTISSTTKPPASIVSSTTSSLCYSASCASSFDPQDRLNAPASAAATEAVQMPLAVATNEDNHNSKTHKEESQQDPFVPIPTECIMEDLHLSFNDGLQEKLLDRLDRAAVAPVSSGAATTTNGANSIIKSSAIESPPQHHQALALYEQQAALVAPQEQDNEQDNDELLLQEEYKLSSEEAFILKQLEKRLLQGEDGSFLNDSAAETTTFSDGDGYEGDDDRGREMPIQSLDRLEAATNNDSNDQYQFQEQYNQDPRFVEASFASSAATAPPSSSWTTYQTKRSSSLPSTAGGAAAWRPIRFGRCASSAAAVPSQITEESSTAVATTNHVDDDATHYTDVACVAGVDKSNNHEDKSHNNGESASLAVSTKSLLEADEDNEDEDDALGPHDENPKNDSKLCYLYSFENSILSPKSVNSASRCPGEAKPHPRSPKNLYRSDAINAFADCMGSEVQPTEEVNQDIKGEDKEKKGGDGDREPATDGTNEGPKIVSEELLNIMTSGCTGKPSPAAKEAIAEKLVALEAGWSGFRTQINETIHDLEESWKSWNIDSLLKFPSKGKTAEASPLDTSLDDAHHKDQHIKTSPGDEAALFAAAMTPTTMGSSTVLTTPPSTSVAKKNGPTSSFAGNGADLVKWARRYEEEEPFYVECSLAEASENENDSIGNHEGVGGEKKIGIESTEHDVPLDLKNTLAEISMIDEVQYNSSSSSSSPHNIKQRMPPAGLDTSREDSEGGKVVLDAAEWDPVEASFADSVHIDLSKQPVKTDGFFYKQKSGGKVLRSPTSVLVEI